MQDREPDRVDFLVPPPVIYLAAVVLGIVIDLWFPLPVLPMPVALGLGAALVAVAGALLGWATRTMLAAGEHPDPDRPTSAIVAGGPYRFSRNPIYLALAVLSAGVALLVNSGWGLALVAPALIATHYWAIAPEERYLEGRFAGEYRAYRSRVRRWI